MKTAVAYVRFSSAGLLKTSNEHLFVSISDNEFVIKAG